MRYVILRDDDTNALTPVECLERLYRPFLDRGLPVNLAVIPEVSTSAVTPEGKPEGFLFARHGQRPSQTTTVDQDQEPRGVLAGASASWSAAGEGPGGHTPLWYSPLQYVTAAS